MKLKRFVRDFMIAGLIVAASANLALAAQVDESAICALINELQGVFRILRTLAFIGAAFMIAMWAWDFIAGGDPKLTEIKKKGLALLVGFVMLFAVGAILTFAMAGNLPGVSCDITRGW